MRADPLAPVRAGDPFVVDATTWNEMLRFLRQVRTGRFGPRSPAPGSAYEHRLVIAVQNDTLSAFAPLAIATHAGTTLDLTAAYYDADRRPAIKAIAPTADTNHPLLVLDGIAPGEYGPALVLGVGVCDVSVMDTSHVRAKCLAADTTKLASGTDGPVTILAKESSGTGVKKCIVLVGGGGGGGSDPWLWAEITGNNGAAEPATAYSWAQRVLTAGPTWAAPAPPTSGTNNLYRPPSNTPSPIAGTKPAIPTGMVTLIRVSPTLAGSYEACPWGGFVTVDVTVVTDCGFESSTCVFTKTTKTLRYTTWDLMGTQV